MRLQTTIVLAKPSPPQAFHDREEGVRAAAALAQKEAICDRLDLETIARLRARSLWTMFTVEWNRRLLAMGFPPALLGCAAVAAIPQEAALPRPAPTWACDLAPEAVARRPLWVETLSSLPDWRAWRAARVEGARA